MGNARLKSSLHKMVDRIEDERLLSAIHSFLKQHENSEEGKMWKELTEKQRQEVLKAFDESEDDSNIISDDEVWNSVK